MHREDLVCTSMEKLIVETFLKQPGALACISNFKSVTRMNGSAQEMGVFWMEWKVKGMREAKADKNWEIWKEVEDMTKPHLEPAGCFVPNCNHGLQCLGRKFYR